MKRLLTSFVASAVLLCWAGSVTAVPLTNSGVSADDICALFDCDGGEEVALLFSDFSFAPAPDPDGLVISVVLAGLSGTDAEDLFLYLYLVENEPDSTETLHGYSVDFPGLYLALDFDGDFVADTSIYCLDLDCPGIAPAGAAFTGNPISFSFPGILGFPDIPPDSSTTFFGAVSTLPPGIAMGTVFNTDTVASPSTLVPVPEPASLILLGSGLLGLGALVRRRA